METFNLNNPSKIKAIIFDFDDTLYFQKNKEVHYINYAMKVVKDLTGLDFGVIKRKFKELNLVKNVSRPRLRDLVGYFGDYKEIYDEYRINNFYMPIVKDCKTIDCELLNKFNKKYLTFLVSGEFVKNIFKKAQALNIDLKGFKKVVGAFDPKINIEKINIYKSLIDEYHLKSDEVCVIGDRFKVDIKPMLDLGGSGFLVSSYKDFEKVSKILNLAGN